MKKLLIVLLVLSSCSTNEDTETSIDREFNIQIGKRITIEGEAANTKFGALVIINDDTSVWIDGLDSWSPEYYTDENDGEIVRVTGTIIERYDLPVYIKRSGEPGRPGMPVSAGTDTNGGTGHRCLLYTSPSPRD